MTLTVNNATVPSVCGPGYAISVITDLFGPFALDDIFSVEVLLPPLTTNYFCGGTALAGGTNSGGVVLGISDIIGQGVLDQYIPPGTTVSLQLALTHANFVSVDTGISTGWTWDPIGGLYQMVAHSAATGSSAEILAAVRRTYP